MKRERSTCYYCDALVSAGGGGDHFPVPDNCGGVVTVACCLSCHDMKDRFNLDRWPEPWINKVIADFPKLSRETKIFLAKTMALLARSGAALDDDSSYSI